MNYIGKNNQYRPKLVIGFSAETEKLLHNSKIKLKNKNADWIIANDVSKKDIGFFILIDQRQTFLIEKIIFPMMKMIFQ